MAISEDEHEVADDFDDEFKEVVLDAHAGIQQQLHYVINRLRLLESKYREQQSLIRSQDVKQRSQHNSNTMLLGDVDKRLEELETVVVKGNGEISLVRKIDKLQTTSDNLKDDLAELIRDLKEKVAEKISNRHWRWGDIIMPLATAALVGLIELLKK